MKHHAFSRQSPESKFLRMTTEPVETLILKLAIPTMISMLVTAFYNLADTFFIRQLNSDSMVAAIGVVMPLMNIIQAIGFYHGHGSGNYISRAFGRQDLKDAEKMAPASSARSPSGFCSPRSVFVSAAVSPVFWAPRRKRPWSTPSDTCAISFSQRRS